MVCKKIQTLSELLLAYVNGERAGTCATVMIVRESLRHPKELLRTLPDIVNSAISVASALQRWGVKQGDVVFVGYPTGFEFIEVFFGAMLAGCLPCAVPPIAVGNGSSLPPSQLMAAIAALQPRLLIVEKAHVQVAAQISTEHLFDVLTLDHLEPGRLVNGNLLVLPADSNELAYLQLTSGSTGVPKAAALSHACVLANLELTGVACAADPSRDRGVIWLPLFHDMGLITLLTAFYQNCSIVLEPPEDFIRSPMSWLRNLSRFKATTTAAPTFALAYCVRRFRPDLLAEADLSNLSRLVVGAERVYLSTLERFVATFAPYGLSGDCLLPSYGGAELTLAASFPPGDSTDALGRYIRRDHLSGHSRESRSQADPTLSMGRPLPTTHIRILGQDCEDLPEGEVGEIHIISPCLMHGYYRDTETTDRVMRDGGFATGDIGYLRNGELYVLGRMKELIILRGKNYYPHEFEDCLAKHPDVEHGRVAAFAVADQEYGTERLVIAVEPERYDGISALRQELQRLLRAEFGFGASDIRFISRGAIPRTTSRKIRRGACQKLYEGGTWDEDHRANIQPINAAAESQVQ